MRDKLIELIGKIQASGIDYPADSERYAPICPTNAELADHLLANGVIVPPCKVGDTVYKISRNKVKECTVIFIGLSADEKYSHLNFVENYTDGSFYKSYSRSFAEIGKTVFLSREDAEKRLAELRGECYVPFQNHQ